MSEARRLGGILFVHAHPDDETIGTGATMARYAAAGVPVTLVTCTLGEEGEIHVPHLAGLASGAADQLGGYRIAELAQACAALGVTDHRFLGGAGRYRDSGMMGTASNDHLRAFWRADVGAAARELLSVIRETRPRAVVGYDPNGFYGHPDHIQAHRVMTLACRLASAEGVAPEFVYWTAMPRRLARAGVSAFAGTSDNPFSLARSVDDLPFCAPEDAIAVRVDASAFAEAKVAAMLAHATQIPRTSWLFSIAGNFGVEPMGVEYYRLADQDEATGRGAPWRTDLLAGLA